MHWFGVRVLELFGVLEFFFFFCCTIDYTQAEHAMKKTMIFNDYIIL